MAVKRILELNEEEAELVGRAAINLLSYANEVLKGITNTNDDVEQFRQDAIANIDKFFKIIYKVARTEEIADLGAA